MKSTTTGIMPKPTLVPTDIPQVAGTVVLSEVVGSGVVVMLAGSAVAIGGVGMTVSCSMCALISCGTPLRSFAGIDSVSARIATRHMDFNGLMSERWLGEVRKRDKNRNVH